MTDTRPLTDYKDWLDEQEFFEKCLALRHAPGPIATGDTVASDAFEELKKYIRDQIDVARSIQG